jgi:4-amino-4-deoxy-L-arabinose transferase-like glycosyltransferase
MTQERRLIISLFAIALGFRVLYAAFASTQPDIIPDPVTGDLTYAKQIASGFGWIASPYSPKAPGYPVVLAMLLLISFKQLWLALFFQAAIGAVTAVVVYFLGKRFLGMKLAYFAALWLAVSPHHMHYSAIFHREFLAVFLLVLLVFLLTRPLKGMRFGVLSGFIFGALAHVDPQYVLLFPLFALFILLKSRHTLLNVQYCFLFAAAFVVFITPWTIRNQFVYGQPIPVALEARDFFRPMRTIFTDSDRALSGVERRVEVVSRTNQLQSNTVEFWRFARLRASAEAENTQTGTVHPPEPAWSLRHNAVAIISYGLLLPFFVIGAVFVIRDKERTGWMLAATTFAYFLMRAYLGGSERARLPVEPFIILLAFYGVLVIFRRFAPVRKPSEQPA